MGLINNDSFTASNGVEKAGTYISFNNETIYLRKSVPAIIYPAGPSVSDSSKAYMINANYRIFWDKAAKDAGKSFIELRNVSTSISEEQLSGNLYGYLYEELKKQYPNSEDELLTKEAAAPAASSDVSTAPAVSSDSAATPAATASDSTTTPQ